MLLASRVRGHVGHCAGRFNSLRMLADYLLLQGLRVLHIDAADSLSEHMLSAELRCEGTARIYDRFPVGNGRA